MRTDFEPSDGIAYLNQLKLGSATVPPKPGEEIKVDDEAVGFSYYVSPDGQYRFTWEDLHLRETWQRWVKAHS
jgi:hypothetical protein